MPSRERFSLDTGHMINNNRDIKNSKEAIEYIKKNIENIGKCELLTTKVESFIR